MSTPRKDSRNDRLEAYLATLRSPWKEALKRGAAHWHLYAAVTGSAMAMATSTSLSGLVPDHREVPSGLVPNLLSARQPFAHAQNSPHNFPHNSPHESPLIRAARLAMARQKSGVFLDGVAPAIADASQSLMPVIATGGIVPIYSTVSVIQPGEWVSIYGSNLATGTAVWNGDFPQSLGGTTVEINGRAAFLSFVSPSQINLQAPDDATVGPVSVVVTTDAGTAHSTVTLSPFSPSFLLRDATHVAAIILTPNGSGAYGGGAYDILGPTGYCFGYYTGAPRPEISLNFLGSGSDQPLPTFKPEPCIRAPRRSIVRSLLTSTTSL